MQNLMSKTNMIIDRDWFDADAVRAIIVAPVDIVHGCSYLNK